VQTRIYMRLWRDTYFPFTLKHLRSISMAAFNLSTTITPHFQKTIDNPRQRRMTHAPVYNNSQPLIRLAPSSLQKKDIRNHTLKF
jgi:hypothetical protein